MLLCDGRGCSRSVPITFRNRKNKMYDEQDYFCEAPLQLCNSKSLKDTSDLWHVYIHQTSFEALPFSGSAVLHPVFPTFLFQRCCAPNSDQEAWLEVPAKVGMKDGLETSSSGTVQTSGTFFRDRRLTVEPVERGRHCQRMVCVSGGLNCLWACFSVLGGWGIHKLDTSVTCLNRRDASELERDNRYLANSWVGCISEFSVEKFSSAAKNTEVLWCSLFSKAPRKRLLCVDIISQELWLLSSAWGCRVSDTLE